MTGSHSTWRSSRAGRCNVQRCWSGIGAIVGLAILLGACAPDGVPTNGASQNSAGGTPADAAPAVPGRTLVIAVGRAPESLAAKPLRSLSGPGNPYSAIHAFNAGLILHDDREEPHPYLAEAI